MPYLWLALVLLFGLHDEVWLVAVLTLIYSVVMWCAEELQAIGERALAYDVAVMWVLEDGLRGEGN